MEELYAVAIIFIAYLIRGIAGFGSGLISIPLLAIFMPLHIVVPMVVLLDYTASLTHGVKNRRDITWKEIYPLLPFSLIGVGAALYLFHQTDPYWLKKGLGTFILLYALYSLFRYEPKSRSKAWAAPMGIFGGLVGGLFGTGGPFYVIYFKLRGLQKAAFRATLSTIFLLDGALRISGYLVTGLFNLDTLTLVLKALPIMLIGLYIGEHVHTSLSQRNFQIAISTLLVISGATLLIK